jgi:hypothetical protein
MQHMFGRLRAIGSWGYGLNAVVNMVLHWKTIMATLTAGATAIWAYWSEIAGPIPPVIIFTIAIVVFAAALSIFNGLGQIFARSKQSKLKDAEAITTATDVIGKKEPQDNPARYHRDRDVYIYDLVVDEQRVVNTTFENCTIFGPAAVWLFKCSMVDPRAEGPDAQIYVGAFSQYAPKGAIIVKHCTFINCLFRRISICVPEKKIDDTRQLLQLLE